MRFFAYGAFAFLMGGAGCSSVTPHVAKMEFVPDAMEFVAQAQGESTSKRALCMIDMGSPASAAAAAKNAAKSVKADAMVNVIVDDERGVGALGLYCWQTIRVSGMAVRFTKNSGSSSASATPGPGSAASPAAGEEADDPLKDMEKKALGQ
jgi:uncharacterized protein YbjQ (UPF0145 family)